MSVRLIGSERTAVGPRYGERAHSFYRENVNRFRDEWNRRPFVKLYRKIEVKR